MQLHSESFSRNCATIAGMVFLVWDFIAICDKEYKFVFKGPATRVKVLYLFARYFAVVVQIISVFSVAGPLSRLPVRLEICKLWFQFQRFSLTVLLNVIEAILVLRVYALYKRNLLVGCILASSVFVEIVVNISGTIQSVHDLMYDAACIITSTPNNVIGLGACVIGTQFMIGGFALWKYKQGLRDGWADIPIVSRVMRDGSSILIALIALVVVSIPFSFLVKDISSIAFALLPSVFSVVACRLIINMQGFTQPTSSSIDVEFTSALDLTTLESRRTLETTFGPGSGIP